MIDNLEIVLGPPGTGKTTRLISYVEDALARKVPSHRIAYLAFTKRAASEAVTRACDKFNMSSQQFPYFRTLHSLCFRLLGLSNAEVMEKKRLQEFGQYAGIRITGGWSDDGMLTGFDTGDRMLFMEHLSRVRGISLRKQFDENDDDLLWHEVERVATAYYEFKRDNGYTDYTDMLIRSVEAGVRPAIDELIVDEVQDLSNAQWHVVAMLAQGCKRVVVAGDDDQAIYKWAGADLDTFLSLPGKVDVLGQSWRVPRAVQRKAYDALVQVTSRREKPWAPRDEEGEVEYSDKFENVDTNGPDVLVLARNDYILKAQVEPALRRSGVIYEKRGHTSVSQSYIDAVVLWERLRKGERINGNEARRVYEQMSSGTGVKRGHKTLKPVADEDTVDMRDLRAAHGLQVAGIWHEALDRIPQLERDYMLNALRNGEKLLRKPRVRISTIHGAKGGEAQNVVLMTEMAQRTYMEMQDRPQDEARVWYVGATRSRQKLTIVNSRTRKCPWL